MATEDIIQKIILTHPEITRAEILEALEIEKSKTGGWISDETLLRLIATKHGVKVPQTKNHNCNLSIGQLIPILNDVTVVGRIVAVYPVRSFEGKQPGKYSSVLIVDKDCLLRVMIWNEKTRLIESGELKTGQIVRFSHAYTREDRGGKTELHLGAKSLVEINVQNADEESYPFIDRFSTKCDGITKPQESIHLVGVVRDVFPASTFTRQDQSNGKVLKFLIGDDTGQVTAVAWNEKADELEPLLKKGSSVILVNAKTKLSSNSVLEVHVDGATYIDFCTSHIQ